MELAKRIGTPKWYVWLWGVSVGLFLMCFVHNSYGHFIEEGDVKSSKGIERVDSVHPSYTHVPIRGVHSYVSILPDVLGEASKESKKGGHWWNRLWSSTWRGVRYTFTGTTLSVGFNLGATAPFSIPKGAHLASFIPAFAPCIALDRDIVFNRWFLLNVGVYMEYKGMTTGTQVHHFYTEVEQREGDASVYVRGEFTGLNTLQVLMGYIGVPMRVGFILNPQGTTLRVGGYVAYSFSNQLKGSVSDGYLWTIPTEEGGNSNKITIKHEEFDFSSELRRFDAGVELSLRQQFNRNFLMDVNMMMGMIPVMKSSFSGIPFKMHNIYLSLGVGYKFLRNNM